MTVDINHPRLAGLAQLIDERLGCSFDLDKRYQLLVLEWVRSEQDHTLQLELLPQGRTQDYSVAIHALTAFFYREALEILGQGDFNKMFDVTWHACSQVD